MRIVGSGPAGSPTQADGQVAGL